MNEEESFIAFQKGNSYNTLRESINFYTIFLQKGL